MRSLGSQLSKDVKEVDGECVATGCGVGGGSLQEQRQNRMHELYSGASECCQHALGG